MVSHKEPVMETSRAFPELASLVLEILDLD